MNRTTATSLALLLDRVLGEPPTRLHPVARFGSVMRAVEERCYRDSRAAGVAHAAIGVGVGAATGFVARSTTLAAYVAIAGRALGRAAEDVGDALDHDDLDTARSRVAALVGRDTASLDEKEVCRAVVESVAENTTDAVVAPALWAAAAGAPGALAYRAVNTLDAMVGYRSARYQRYGWASARLDDTAGWVPARATAALVAAVRPRTAAAVWQCVRRDAPTHPSPNAGVTEAAFAAALGLRFGGANRYGDRTEVRPPLGDGRPPERVDIGRAIRLSRDVGTALATTLAVSSLLRRKR